jgi:hypothetical protein
MTDQWLSAAVRRDLAPALALGVGGIALVFALDALGFVDAWVGHSVEPLGLQTEVAVPPVPIAWAVEDEECRLGP